jgi:hypothetical protein
MMKKLITTGAKITATKEGRKMAKEAFRKLFKKHKSEVRRTKRTKGYVPTIPYNLKKADLKRKIRGTKLTTAAEIKAVPGARRRILLRIERNKRSKKGGRPTGIFGKAYASDKPGRTMQIQPLTFQQRKLMKKEMAESAKRLYKKMFLSKKKKGGLNTIKMVKKKLEKASAAHAGQAKALSKVLNKKKLLAGGLLTSGIKSAARKLFKSGVRKTQEIVKESGGTRAQAKSDVKSAIRDELKGRLSKKDVSISSPFYNKKLRRMLIRDINKLK